MYFIHFNLGLNPHYSWDHRQISELLRPQFLGTTTSDSRSHCKEVRPYRAHAWYMGGSVHCFLSNKYVLRSFCEPSIIPAARNIMVSEISLERATELITMKISVNNRYEKDYGGWESVYLGSLTSSKRSRKTIFNAAYTHFLEKPTLLTPNQIWFTGPSLLRKKRGACKWHLPYPIVSSLITSSLQGQSPLWDYTLFVGRQQAIYMFEHFILSIKVCYFNK